MGLFTSMFAACHLPPWWALNDIMPLLCACTNKSLWFEHCTTSGQQLLRLSDVWPSLCRIMYAPSTLDNKWTLSSLGHPLVCGLMFLSLKFADFATAIFCNGLTQQNRRLLPGMSRVWHEKTLNTFFWGSCVALCSHSITTHKQAVARAWKRIICNLQKWDGMSAHRIPHWERMFHEKCVFCYLTFVTGHIFWFIDLDVTVILIICNHVIEHFGWKLYQTNVI